MISMENNCILVKVPKTAGTSMAQALRCEHVIRPHRNIREIRDALMSIGLRIEDFFKFGFVRNPWDRTVSLYNRNEGIQLRSKMGFEEFVGWIEYSSDTCVFPSKHKNQLDWFVDEHGRVLADFIGTYENLERDWAHVCARLGVSVTLPHTRQNPHNARHYTEYYDQKTRDIIAQKFRVDIEYFGYTFGG